MFGFSGPSGEMKIINKRPRVHQSLFTLTMYDYDKRVEEKKREEEENEKDLYIILYSVSYATECVSLDET